jgi:hypothetical protein
LVASSKNPYICELILRRDRSSSPKLEVVEELENIPKPIHNA